MTAVLGTQKVRMLIFVALLSGCTVGPNYKEAPQIIDPGASFVRATAPSQTEPVSRWWTQLNDPLLDTLIDGALQASPTVNSATARLREARAALASERAKELPSSGASAALNARLRRKN